MRPSPTKQEAKRLGVSARAVRAKAQRHRIKAEAEARASGVNGKTTSKGYITAVAAARIRNMEAIAKKRAAIRAEAGAGAKMGDKLGAAGAVERLRRYEHQCAKELELARKSGDADVEKAAHETWLKAADQLRKSENDAPKVDALNKDQIPIGEVESEWTRAILVFRKTLESSANRIASNPLISTTDRVKLKELLVDEHTRALQALEKVNWEDDEDGAGK